MTLEEITADLRKTLGYDKPCDTAVALDRIDNLIMIAMLTNNNLHVQVHTALNLALVATDIQGQDIKLIPTLGANFAQDHQGDMEGALLTAALRNYYKRGGPLKLAVATWGILKLLHEDPLERMAEQIKFLRMMEKS
jgi:hypothetical protein